MLASSQNPSALMGGTPTACVLIWHRSMNEAMHIRIPFEKHNRSISATEEFWFVMTLAAGIH